MCYLKLYCYVVCSSRNYWVFKKIWFHLAVLIWMISTWFYNEIQPWFEQYFYIFFRPINSFGWNNYFVSYMETGRSNVYCTVFFFSIFNYKLLIFMHVITSFICFAIQCWPQSGHCRAVQVYDIALLEHSMYLEFCPVFDECVVLIIDDDKRKSIVAISYSGPEENCIGNWSTEDR